MSKQKKWREAYFELREAVLDLKDARAAEITNRTPGRLPSVREWGEFNIRLSRKFPALAVPFQRLLRKVSEVHAKYDLDRPEGRQ